MGAWIEILSFPFEKLMLASHPIWVRGLKYSSLKQTVLLPPVAPHMGAWIEILLLNNPCDLRIVAPHMGAWIEMIILKIS